MKKILWIAGLASIAWLNVAPVAALADSPVKTREVKTLILTDQAGMTLYVFDKDGPNVSNCNGGCAAVWPPVVAPADPVAPPLSVITRADGTRQLALRGRALYTYARDAAPGEISGDMVQNTWHLAKP